MTNTKANLNVRIDANIKESAAEILEGLGIDYTTAIELFFRQLVSERRLPFQPSLRPTLSEQILSVIKEKNIPEVTLECDENGNVIIDKEKHPELYDWAVNG